MQRHRPVQQLKISMKGHNNQHPHSLQEGALRQLALAHNGLFTPTDDEYKVLMTVKNNNGDLENVIKSDLEVLLQHIVCGEQAEAEKMIDELPHLLLLSGTVIDYSRRMIVDVTPVQLAFGGEDEVMCAMLKEKMCAYYDSAFSSYELGVQEFSRQISEKFHKEAEPEKISIVEFEWLMTQLVAAINDPLANITDELNHVPNESSLRHLLDEFRMKFAPGVVRAGKHFNVQFLIRALQVYTINYEAWGYERSQIFWQQIAGYLARLLPVSYVQAGCQDINNVLKGEPLKRILTLHDGSSYYPLESDPACRLGYDHGVYFADGGFRSDIAAPRWLVDELLRQLKSRKNFKFSELMLPVREENISRIESKSRCVMC